MIEPVAPPSRSGFVTGLAWVTLVLAAFGTFVAIMQNIMLSVLPMDEGIAEVMDPSVPAAARLLFEHFRLVAVSMLIGSLATVIISIALLRRHNWARVAFIGLMVISIVGNLASMGLPFVIMSEVPEAPIEDDFSRQLAFVMQIVLIFTALLALAASVLCGWIIKKLMSGEIRREFA